MPRPCEHDESYQPLAGDKSRGSALMRTQVISLWLVTSHDVAGSEAEVSASSNGGEYPFVMTNMPYFFVVKNYKNERNCETEKSRRIKQGDPFYEPCTEETDAYYAEFIVNLLI